ncbi:MAG: hypothetical protein ABSA78_13275 [Candidatus Sulfotelmatobacter sp.]
MAVAVYGSAVEAHGLAVAAHGAADEEQWLVAVACCSAVAVCRSAAEEWGRSAAVLPDVSELDWAAVGFDSEVEVSATEAGQQM